MAARCRRANWPPPPGSGLTAASGHLAKLVEGRLLAMQKSGRHRYYRLAGPAVAAVIEDLAQLAPLPAILRPPGLPPAVRALRLARSCYDHLAGELAVGVAAALEERQHLKRSGDRRYEPGGEGARRWFAGQGIDLRSLRPTRHGLGRQCLDWTERRPHLAGPLGAALFTAWCAAGWLRRHPVQPRLVEVTDLGRTQFRQELGIIVPADGASGMTPSLFPFRSHVEADRVDEQGRIPSV